MHVDQERALLQVLDGLRFPAAKWQILTQAELYGADVRTRGELLRLPTRQYRSTNEITEFLNAS
ncbi:DUF2795 domain-containing protein [Actinophytocola sp.]|uniref:DUF2795 domain-containing protein n=1 Tax=Actinophytocola sp. TaxID=1872138 RepID=UPI002D7F50EA|nr:DUF2795 domain-containing protein [Actinophytocola sp.]HET9141811.1 DUF2795 domain-containing protein [Actinophytocola sp.]